MKIEDYLSTNCWFDYKPFYSWLSSQKNINIIAEIGSWKGHSTSFIAKRMAEEKKIFKIYAIDVWEKWENYTVFDESQKDLLDEVRQSHDIFIENIKRAGVQKYIIDIQEDSHHAHAQFENDFFDCVFLDADHKYDVVKKDIELWYPKVRKNGIFAGHDYYQKSTPECGVKRAVDEIFDNVNVNGSVWYITK